MKTRCKYLAGDNRCRIYFNRPKICREYTTEECEYDDDWSFTKMFETPEQIWEYAEAVLPPPQAAQVRARAGLADPPGPTRPARAMPRRLTNDQKRG